MLHSQSLPLQMAQKQTKQPLPQQVSTLLGSLVCIVLPPTQLPLPPTQLPIQVLPRESRAGISSLDSEEKQRCRWGGGLSRSEAEVALPPSPLALPPAAVLEPPALGAHAASEFKKLSGTQLTCFTGTTAQILTQLFLRDAARSGCLGLQA